MEQQPLNDRSRQMREWHRDYRERKIGGVCAGVAAQLGASVTAVRAAFILLTLFPPFHGLGVWLYLVLWFLMPAEPGVDSGLDRSLDFVNSLTGGRHREQDLGPDSGGGSQWEDR